MKHIFQHKWLKYIGLILLVLVLLFIGIVLGVRSTWGQKIIVDKTISYVSEITKTKIALEKLYVTFSGNIFMEGLYVEDRKRDTLLYSKNLEASIALLPLIRGNEFRLKSLNWNDVVLKLKREDEIKSSNYQFLIDTFASEDSLSVQKPKNKEDSTLRIVLGEFDLKNIKVNLDDQYSGIKTSLQLGHLNTQINDFDLEKMRFAIDNVDLDQTHFVYQQTKLAPQTSEDTTATQLPFVHIESFNVSHVSLDYKSVPTKQSAQIQLTEVLLEELQTDLSKKEITLDKFVLSKSKIMYANVEPVTKKTIAPSDSTLDETALFEWPDWTIRSDEFAILESILTIELKDTLENRDLFDYNNLKINKLNFVIDQFSYQPKTLAFQLKRFDFVDQSGFHLQKFGMNVAATDSQTIISHLNIQTNNSTLSAAVDLQYKSINQLIKKPEETVFQFSVPTVVIDPTDASFFTTALEGNPYVSQLSQKTLDGTIKAKGKLGDFSLIDTKINWGTHTTISTAARIQRILQVDSLSFDITELNAVTTRKDLVPFVPKEQLTTLQPPENITFRGTATGGVTNFKFDTQLITSDGNVGAKGAFKNQEQLAFDGTVSISELQLDKILKNEQLGTLSLDAKIKEEGSSVNNLNVIFHSDFKKLQLNGYDFSALQLESTIKNGKGHASANYKDDNLNLKLHTAIALDSINPRFDLKLNLIGADLNRLGITQKIIKTQFDLTTVFEGNSDVFTLNTVLTDATVVYDNEPFSVNEIVIDAKTNTNNSSLTVDSAFLKGNLEANAAIPAITDAIQRHFEKHLKQKLTPPTDSLTVPVRMDLQFKFKETPVLSDVFLQGLQSSDTTLISATFEEEKHQLVAKINTPTIRYKEGELDSLNFKLHSTQENLDFSLDWKGLDYTPLAIKETSIHGSLNDDILFLDFDASDKENTIARIQSEITLQKDSLYIHINPNSMFLDRTAWEILPNNRVVIAPNFLVFEAFEISKNQQSIKIQSHPKGTSKEHLNFEFNNFNLNTVTSFLNPDQLLMSGILDGKIRVEEPFGATGFVSDVKIQDLAITEVPLGLLSLDARSKNFSAYDLDLSLKGPDVTLQLTGDYSTAGEQPTIALNFQLKELQVPLIEKFASDYISNTKGTLSGSAIIDGNLDAPIYNGAFHFNKSQLKVNSLNTRFLLPEENIRVDNKGIYLDQFTIADKDNSTFILDGSVKTKTPTNPSFNLTLNAKNFQVLNATKEDNELFYGLVNISSKLKITGTMEVPKIRGTIGVDENSDFTLVVPESELEVQEQKGVVLFVNRKNPDAILTKNTTTDSDIMTLKGFDINTKLSIGKKSLFKIIIDERSGDYIKVHGTGDLLFGMQPNGMMSLSGKYEISDGQYKASLYNLVKRKFDIAKGSTITWNGDPLDADLDVKAIYEIKTNAAPLMSVGASSAALDAPSAAYNRSMDFLVYLNVDGELLEPEISFAMDIPEAQQGLAGGQVYGRIQQLNNQDTELNKQVFSLLVFNRFFPAVGSDGSNGGAASIARDNVNRVLSDQLNNFSDRLIGKTGVELDFQLDSYNNQSTTTTDLEVNAKKKLLNDRLIVQVGSAVNVEGNSQATQNSSPIIGNVSLEYLLSEKGKYRLKGFRKNEFESVIDGQLIITGIAFIFNREFNKFKELWTATAKKTITENEKIQESKKQLEKEKRK